MEAIIKKLSAARDLSSEECRNAIELIVSSRCTPVQTAAFLMALSLKGETPEEILGAAQVLRKNARSVKHHQQKIFDNCGTGGDGSGTFNISTTAAFVVAACGVPVAKHGNRSISSKCGSSDVLERLGVDLSLGPEQVGECIDEIGIGFLYAPNFHPAMKAVASVRKELGIRTIFNLLGPLSNPARATHQLIGVFNGRYLMKIARAARDLEIGRVMTAFNSEGIDEITTAGINKICLGENGSIREYELNPESYGFAPCSLDDLAGGDSRHNADITRSILKGRDGAMKDTVVFSAAVSLFIAEKAASIEAGIEMANDCLNSGAALEKLKELIELTGRLGRA